MAGHDIMGKAEGVQEGSMRGPAPPDARAHQLWGTAPQCPKQPNPLHPDTHTVPAWAGGTVGTELLQYTGTCERVVGCPDGQSGLLF